MLASTANAYVLPEQQLEAETKTSEQGKAKTEGTIQPPSLMIKYT
jgi:hypothetical protein